MSRRNKIIISLTGIFIISIALLGLTYGYFLTKIVGNTNSNSVNITTKNLRLVYGDGSESVIESDTLLIPSNNAIGVKDFTVTNDGEDTEYSVIIDNVSIKNTADNTDTTFVSNDFRFTLSCTITSSDSSRNNTKCGEVLDQKSFPINGGILISDKIIAGDIHNYELTFWYIETNIDQSDDMGKTYSARVNIVDITTINPYDNDSTSLAYNVINNAKQNMMNDTSGTKLVNVPLSTPLEEKINWKYVKPKDPTEPDSSDNYKSLHSSYVSYSDDYELDENTGKFTLKNKDGSAVETIYYDALALDTLNNKYVYWANTESDAKNVTNLNEIYVTFGYMGGMLEPYYDILYASIVPLKRGIEKTLAPVQDNYGTSYYFRGGVEDNYVLFNNMCFRIVRIEGDGSVKLILDGEVAEGSTNCENITSNSTYVETYYYGNKDINGVDGNTWSIADFNDASPRDGWISLKDALNNWITQKFRIDGDANNELSSSGQLLKEDLWCLGSDYNYKYSKTSNTLLSNNNASLNSNALIDGYYKWNYAVGNRLYNTKSVDLTCDHKEGEVESLVGALTMDEVALAGVDYQNVEQVNYLTENISNSIYLMSVAFFEKGSGVTEEFGYGGDFILAMKSNGSFCVHTSHDHVPDAIGLSNCESYVLYSRPTITLIPNTKITAGIGTKEQPYIIDVE